MASPPFSIRREESVTTEHEESVRQQILEGLIADKGGDQQISTATRILSELSPVMLPGSWFSTVPSITSSRTIPRVDRIH
jgi:hypothetical protein